MDDDEDTCIVVTRAALIQACIRVAHDDDELQELLSLLPKEQENEVN